MLLLFYLWVVPGDERLFVVAFAVANGPLPFAGLMFKNALVFHSPDKIVNCSTHILPTVVTFVIRWYGEEIRLNAPKNYGWYAPKNYGWSICDSADGCASFTWTLGWPFAFYITHQLFCLLCVGCLCKIPKDPQYLTLYRYLAVRKQGLLFKVTGLYGPRLRPVVYAFVLSLKCFVSFIPVYVWYRSFYAHLIFVLLLVTFTIYNGANFYVEIFSRKYQTWIGANNEKK
jgi:hypothetical protein